jgi:hypothetical protein
MEIRLEPSITCCIEKTAKREYERILSLLLKVEKADTNLEEEFELLRVFLESADFGKLRSHSEDVLNKGGRVEFILRSVDSVTPYEIEINQLESNEEEIEV